jgi:hypothetical protein
MRIIEKTHRGQNDHDSRRDDRDRRWTSPWDEELMDSQPEYRGSPGKVSRTTTLAVQKAKAEARAEARAEAAPQGARRQGTGNAIQQASRAAVQLKTRNGSPLPAIMTAEPGPGVALPAELRERMERFFDEDFSAVRIHEDPHASVTGVLAYARGDALFFAPGQYDPGSRTGVELIAHELAHVVQQRAGRVAAEPGSAINRDRALESEADQLGARAARAESAPSPAMSPPAARDHAGADSADRAASGTGSASPSTPGAVAQARTQNSGDLDASVDASAKDTHADSTEPGAADDTKDELDATAGDTASTLASEPKPDSAIDSADASANAGTAGAQAGAQTTQTTDAGADARQSTGPGITPGNNPLGGTHSRGNTPHPPPAPSASPGSAPQPSDPLSSTEGLVDYYMEVNWSDSAYQGHFNRIGGVPVRMGKTLLPVPPQAAPGASTAANFIAGIGAGLIDAVVWNGLKAVPLLGVGPMFLDYVKACRDSFRNEEATDDQGNLSEGILAMSIARAIFDFVGGAAGNIANTISLLQDAGLLLAVVTEGFSALLEALLPIGEACRAISACCELVKTGLDAAMMVGNIFLARRLEAEGNKRGADKARELASGNALDTIMDGLASVAAIAELATLNHAGGGEILTHTMQDAIANTGEQTFDSAMRALAAEGLARAGKSGLGSINPIGSRPGLRPGAPQSANTAADIAQIADTGKRIGGHGRRVGQSAGLSGNPASVGTVSGTRALRGSGQAAGLIGPARQATLDSINQANQDLSGAAPVLWHQKLITDFTKRYGLRDVANDTLDWMTSPSAWIRSFISSLPLASNVINWLLQQAGDNPGVVAGIIQGLTPGGPAIAAVFDSVGQWLGDNKDDIKSTAQEVTDLINTHQVSLQVVQDAIAQGRQFLTDLSQVTDQKGTLETDVVGLISNLNGLKIAGFSMPPIDAALIRRLSGRIPGLGGIAGRLGGMLASMIPDAVLEQARQLIENAVNEAIATWNRLVDDAITAATEQAQDKIAEFDTWIDERTTVINDFLAQLEAELADGGEIQQLLQRQYEKVQAMVNAANEAIQQWDGTGLDFQGAVSWLIQVAQALMDNLDASRGQDYQRLMQEWTAVMDGEAQPWVTQWKAAHAQSVELAAYPPVPAGEVSAALSAVAAVEQRLAQWEAALEPDSGHHGVVAQYRRILGQIRGDIQSSGGKRGEGPLQDLWSAEDRLIALDNQLAQQTSSGAGSGGAGGP